jgi:hypothetical protein
MMHKLPWFRTLLKPQANPTPGQLSLFCLNRHRVRTGASNEAFRQRRHREG